MNGTTEIIAVAEAEPLDNEMVSNMEAVDTLARNGVELGKKGARYEDDGFGFHGIQTRWHVPDSINSYKLAREAGQKAVVLAKKADPDYSPERVRVVHSGGSSPDRLYSSCANRLQDELGIPPTAAEARDISLACSSEVDALILAERSLRCIARQDEESEPIYGIVAVGEAIGTAANQPDSVNYLLWGCGGAALVVKHTPDGDERVGLLRGINISDGRYAHWAESPGIGCDPAYIGCKPNSIMGESGKYGRDIQDYIMGPIVRALQQFLTRCRVNPAAENSWLFSHNPTYDGAVAFGKAVGFADARVHTVAAKRGNTSSTSPFLNYCDARRRDLLKSGDTTIFVGYGAGMSAAFVHAVES